MFVNQIHQKSEKAKEKIDMENSVSKARKSAGDLGSFHIFSQDPNQIKVIYYITVPWPYSPLPTVFDNCTSSESNKRASKIRLKLSFVISG